MNTLAEYQKTMLALIKGRTVPLRTMPVVTDGHLTELTRSRGLGLLREVAVWWRGFAVESACPWTTRLLKKLGSFQSSIEAFYRGQDVSPYVEKAGEQFLFKMSASPEPLVLAMARLELALMRVRQGSADEYLAEWDRNPELVFQALRSGSELPPAEPGVRYCTYISRDIPELVRCECCFTAEAQA
ncbi:MAG TPA: hypothetical protein VKL99_05220 [Candidatus Angelobacter sp.]|nr:hypothetical protein [Candidatus Angelobacter sp.]